MNNYAYTNIKFQIDSTNNLIIESIKNGNKDIGEIPVLDFISSQGDIDGVVASVNNYFNWDEVGYNNRLYKPFVDELNSKVKAIRKSLPGRAEEDFFNLKSQIDELVASGGITEKDAIRTITNEYQGMTITYKNGSRRDLSSYLDMVYKSQTFGAARQRSEEVAKLLDLKVYKLSTHSNPRTSCDRIQSTAERLFSFDSSVTSFKGLPVLHSSVADYGEAFGLGGVNCTHFWIGVQDFGDLKRKVPGADKFNDMEYNPEVKYKLDANYNEFIGKKKKLDKKFDSNNITESDYKKEIKSNNKRYIKNGNDVLKGGDVK